VSTHLGYLANDEYERAYRYVLAKRAAEHLPGIPKRASVLTYLRKQFSRLAIPSGKSTSDSKLLEKVIEETERHGHHRD